MEMKNFCEIYQRWKFTFKTFFFVWRKISDMMGFAKFSFLEIHSSNFRSRSHTIAAARSHVIKVRTCSAFQTLFYFYVIFFLAIFHNQFLTWRCFNHFLHSSFFFTEKWIFVHSQYDSRYSRATKIIQLNSNGIGALMNRTAEQA